jgi:hypothetical protein
VDNREAKKQKTDAHSEEVEEVHEYAEEHHQPSVEEESA